MNSTAIVLTTINIPTSLLMGYIENFKKYKHDNTAFIVIGDLKTPNEPNELLVNDINKIGFHAEYWDIDKQNIWLNKFQRLSNIMPYNSDTRRNIGYLRAVELGAETIISIDDDNFAGDDDFINWHNIVGETMDLKTAFSENLWFNSCSLLDFNPPGEIYARGFPYDKRWQNNTHFNNEEGKIMLNMGLWENEPDVDAITRLNKSVVSIGMKSDDQIMLGNGIFTPINTQNTAFHRELLPCFYCVLMGAKIDGNIIDRYGDIWGGLFVKMCMDKMGHRVAIGNPMVKHIRNKHDLFKDLRFELWGMILTQFLVSTLSSVKLTKNNYTDLYLELAQIIGSADIYSHQDVRNYFKQLSIAMEIWVESCDLIMNHTRY
jgi:hypothetical protein